VATLSYDAQQVQVRLSRWEKVAALHGDLTVPRDAVVDARTTRTPLREVSGLRLPGTYLPTRVALGTYVRDGRTFAAAYRRPGVVLQLEGRRYSRIVVSVEDGEQVVRDLTPRP